MFPTQQDILKIVSFKTSRSGGAGGQHVNKVSSKVELILDLQKMVGLSEEELVRLKVNLASRLDSEGLLHVVAQESRSQLLNKQKAIVKLLGLLNSALKVQKVRKELKLPKAVKEKRLKDKAQTSQKKETRRRPSLN